jgi:hypothetical protein
MQQAMNTIAASIDRPYRPIGSLAGRIAGIITINDNAFRVVTWRRHGGSSDSILTLLPAKIVALELADYAAGNKSLKFDYDNANHTPFVATTTVLATSLASALPESGGLAFSIPPHDKIGFLGGEESELYEFYKTSTGQVFKGSYQTYTVTETQDDKLAGLCVVFARGHAGNVFLESSHDHEKVSI